MPFVALVRAFVLKKDQAHVDVFWCASFRAGFVYVRRGAAMQHACASRRPSLPYSACSCSRRASQVLSARRRTPEAAPEAAPKHKRTRRALRGVLNTRSWRSHCSLLCNRALLQPPHRPHTGLLAARPRHRRLRRPRRLAASRCLALLFRLLPRVRPRRIRADTTANGRNTLPA